MFGLDLDAMDEFGSVPVEEGQAADRPHPQQEAPVDPCRGPHTRVRHTHTHTQAHTHRRTHTHRHTHTGTGTHPHTMQHTALQMPKKK